MNKMVKLDDIIIPRSFEKKKPKLDKLTERMEYFEQTGLFYVPIVVTDDLVLMDGYTSYLLAKKYNLTKVKVEYI